MDDNELIAKIRADKDDTQAFVALFDRYFLLTTKILQRFALNDFTRDDWLQEARIAMYTACMHFDFARGDNFAAYYATVLHSHLNSLLRARLAQKRVVNLHLVLTGFVKEPLVRYSTGRKQEDDYLIGVDLAAWLAGFTDAEAASLLAAMQDDGGDAVVQRARERTRRRLEQYLKRAHERARASK